VLKGGRARPHSLPGSVRTTFLGAHAVTTFPDYELRCIAVEGQDGPRMRLVNGRLLLDASVYEKAPHGP
jgi:hypothetical protein